MVAIKKRVQQESEKLQDDFIDGYLFGEDKLDTNSMQKIVIDSSKDTKEPFKSIPESQEIKLDPKKYILSKTDTKGIIEYGNEYFVEISGYSEEELIGKPHNIIRHPDMPKIVFKLLWQRIKNREDITAVVKNLAKDGRYYWVMTEFDIKVDKITDGVVFCNHLKDTSLPNKIHVINSLLVNAIVKEHTPSILLRLKLRPGNNVKLSDLIRKINMVFNESKIPVFRIHENQIEISRIRGEEIVLNLNVTPISMPIRVSDMIRLINHLMESLREYNPEIEIVK